MAIRELKEILRNKIKRPAWMQLKQFYNRFMRNSFVDLQCANEKQFEGSIIRLYHTLEKGLTYENYRPGFGKQNVSDLISSLEQYASKYDISKDFYETALSVLQSYVKKNQEYGLIDEALESRIKKLPGIANHNGGAISFTPLTEEKVQQLGFKDFAENRHSIRHFSNETVDINRVLFALKIAQNTPSACNRQGWKTIIIENKNTMKTVLDNQNGNRGFGNEFDKLLLVVGDLRLFQKKREINQVFVDGGMYAMNLLNALHYEHIASIPLSAALTIMQEENIRKALSLDDAEVPILFIGIGNYPSNCVTTASKRHEPYYELR